MSLMVIRVLTQYLLLLNPSTKHQSIEDDLPVYLEDQKIAYIEREIYIRIQLYKYSSIAIATNHLVFHLGIQKWIALQLQERIRVSDQLFDSSLRSLRPWDYLVFQRCHPKREHQKSRYRCCQCRQRRYQRILSPYSTNLCNRFVEICYRCCHIGPEDMGLLHCCKDTHLDKNHSVRMKSHLQFKKSQSYSLIVLYY